MVSFEDGTDDFAGGDVHRSVESEVHDAVRHCSSVSAAVNVKSKRPKFIPNKVTLAPPLMAELPPTNVSAGASNDSTETPVPTPNPTVSSAYPG